MNRLAYQTVKMTIVNGTKYADEKVNLKSGYKRCIGYGIPGPLSGANVLHTQPFTVGIEDNRGESIQDPVNANDMIFIPGQPVDKRYKAADFPANGENIKVVAATPANVGADFSFDLVFVLSKD